MFNSRKTRSALRTGALVLAAVAALGAPAVNAQGLNGPAAFEAPGATNPSRGALEILREAERQPRLGDRFDLPRLSGPVDLDLPPVFRDNTALAPPAARPQRAERYGGR